MKKYLKAYLYNRPFFYSFIRPKELNLFERHLPFKGPVLDFGCGDGFFAKTLLGKDKIGVGIDVNKKVRKEAEGSSVYNKVIIYDGKRLLFKDNYFSTVISNCVMEHVEDLDTNLGEIYRVTKVGGVFYLTVMTNNWEKYLLGGKIFGKKYLNWMKKIQKHLNLLSEMEWENTFHDAGFRLIDKFGYIDKTDARLIEVFHYLSIDSLFSRKLLGKWVLLPQRFKLFENSILKRVQKNKISVNSSAAVFYVLRKVK